MKWLETVKSIQSNIFLMIEKTKKQKKKNPS